MPSGAKIMVSTNSPPSTIDQRWVTELTTFSSTMITTAPTMPPNSVPTPPMMTINRPFTDCVRATVEGLTKLLK